MASDTYERIYQIVDRIPAGSVATYGQIARLAGLGGHARLVGYALHACGRSLPWHRVINSRGQISDRSNPHSQGLQARRLAAEGVTLDERGRISLDRYRWGENDPQPDPWEEPPTS